MNIIKRKKVGFTLLELLSTIVILGILLVIGFSSVTRLIDKSKEEQLNHQKATLQMAAESYLQSNNGELPESIGESIEVKASFLRQTNYIKEDIYNANGESCMKNSYVKVYKSSKNKYKYTAYICCGNKKCPVIKAESNPVIKVFFTNINSEQDNDEIFNDVSDAWINIDIKGNSKGTAIIQSYNFSLSAKTTNSVGEVLEKAEVYSSGSLSANNSKHIEIKKKISDYVDITGKTDFSIEIIAINDEGGITRVDSSQNDPNNADYNKESNASYKDNVKPHCSQIFTSPQFNESEWINKYSIGINGAASRKIIATCEDGSGSGCIRERFTRTWPNTKQKSAEYAYIQVRDNAGNTNVDDNFINNADPCNVLKVEDSCRVKVNVDTSSPTVKITSNSFSGTKEANDSKNLNISISDYNNLTNNWINSSKYSKDTSGNIIYFNVVVEDDIHIDKWIWKTKGGLLGNKDSSSGNFKDIDFNLNESNCGLRNKDKNGNNIGFRVAFKEEGKREGTLEVYDKAGNHTDIVISAQIDLTPPTISDDSILYNYWKSNSDNKIGNIYHINDWTSTNIAFRSNISKITDSLSGYDHLHFELRNNKTGTGTAIENKNTKDRYDVYAAGKNGDYNVRFSACDKAGNCTGLHSKLYQIRFDTKKPTCEAKVTSGTKIAGTDWYKSNVVVSLQNITDGSGSGVASYGMNDKNTQTFNSKTSLTLTSAKNTTIYGFVKDKVGNIGSCTTSTTIKIDKTNPSCILKITGTKGSNGWYKSSNVTVSFKSKTDNESGIDKYFLSTTKKKASSVSFPGSNTNSKTQGNTKGVIWYGYVKDKAGRTGRCETETIKLDKNKPTASLSTRQVCGTVSSGRYYAKQTTISMTDSGGSGLSKNLSTVRLKADYKTTCTSGSRTQTYNSRIVNGNNSFQTAVRCFCGSRGFHCNWTAQACDIAGNCSSTKTSSVSLNQSLDPC